MTEYKCGSAETCQFGEMCKPNYDIGGCSHFTQKKPQTNEEWFCGLPTEEKVAALVDLHRKVRMKMRTEIGGENGLFKGDYHREWLKEIHNVESGM